MRFGGPIFVDSNDPAVLAKAHRALSYRAAYCPDFLTLNDLPQIQRTKEAFFKEDVAIAEVGAWSNPLSLDAEEAKKAQEHISARLALADEIGARCCVNILGSWCKTGRWDGPDPSQYGDDFFDACVEVYRKIIDQVKPKRSFMTFETMPYYFLDCPEEYLRLLVAIDRPAAAVHLDVCNCVNSVRTLMDTSSLIRRSFKLLGPKIRSCHLKDITLDDRQGCTAQFIETQPGQGQMDIGALLSHADALGDVSVMLEHLPSEQAYLNARQYVLDLMEKLGIANSNAISQ